MTEQTPPAAAEPGRLDPTAEQPAQATPSPADDAAPQAPDSSQPATPERQPSASPAPPPSPAAGGDSDPAAASAPSPHTEPSAAAAPTPTDAETAPATTEKLAAAPPVAADDGQAKPAATAKGAAAPLPVRTGTIASVGEEEVVVEFTGKREGRCPLNAFAKTPRIGQRLGFVVAPDQDDNATGPLQILRPAVGAAAPNRTPIKQLNVGDVFDAAVVGMNTGGLEVKVAGHRAFLPASQVDRKRVDNFLPYLNKTLRCRIVELNRRKRRIVVSHRSILEDEDRAALGEKMAHIKPGEVRECKVRNVEKFGVFLEWEPGIDGLVRLADLSHNRVDDPKSVVKKGDIVKAKVLRVEPEKARLTLGIRQATPSPWRSVEDRYAVGSDQTGTVTRTTDFGAFVELEPGVEGLIHISQLAPQRVERVEQVVKEGQQVTARVMQCDGRRKRIGLSIRALTEPEAMPTGRASRDDLRKYVKNSDKAHAGQSLGSLMEKFGGGDGLKGGIG